MELLGEKLRGKILKILKIASLSDQCTLRSDIPKLGVLERGDPINCSEKCKFITFRIGLI